MTATRKVTTVWFKFKKKLTRWNLIKNKFYITLIIKENSHHLLLPFSCRKSSFYHHLSPQYSINQHFQFFYLFLHLTHFLLHQFISLSYLVFLHFLLYYLFFLEGTCCCHKDHKYQTSLTKDWLLTQYFYFSLFLSYLVHLIWETKSHNYP